MSKVSPNHEVKRTMTGQAKYVDAFPSRGRRLLPNDNYSAILLCQSRCLQSRHNCPLCLYLLDCRKRAAPKKVANNKYFFKKEGKR